MPWSTRPRNDRYGHAHAMEAKRRRETLTEQDSCGYCGRPLGPRQTIDPRSGRKVGLWHLPHSPCGTYYLPGMWHKRCNEREAAIRARARQTVSRIPW